MSKSSFVMRLTTVFVTSTAICLGATTPVVSGPLSPGQTSISGAAAPNTRVSIFVEALAPLAPASCAGTPLIAVNADATGHFTSPSFSPPLQAGDSAWVCQQVNPIPDPAPNPVPSAVVTVLATAENEREHTDFVGGALFSANGNNYSQGNIFLALNYDRAIKSPGFYKNDDHKNWPPGFNTFFQARLTSIPVNTSLTTTATDSTAPAATASSTSVSSFLSSQKTGQFEGGMYFPITFAQVPKSADADHKTQIFYIAPLARFGFSTPSNPSTNATVTKTGSITTTTTPTSLGKNTTDTNRLYNFWLIGARIATADLDPGSMHTRHYFDVGIGKYSNLQSLYCKAGVGQCQSATTPANVDPTLENRTTILRLVFQGYLELPIKDTSTFILGLSANTSPGIFSRKAGFDQGNHAADDLSFLFGYKFDASKLFAGFKFIGQ